MLARWRPAGGRKVGGRWCVITGALLALGKGAVESKQRLPASRVVRRELIREAGREEGGGAEGR
ncbi:hypothetical protein PAHAL_9G553900 [Panicum hallii]|uniref:DUF834 domain-containing protein n=1 Tax=Panicum hallii TaxID=206008 RepID=A0A2T8I5U2_9POAL|nr:hypothetical protein PAHAL_9G553900 [Panicum hallii]